jgi:hypothetical protein
MNLETRYLQSDKDINPIKYNKMTKFNVDRSILNIDTMPSKYNTKGKLYTAGDTSNLNRDVIPPKYNP